MGISIKLNSWHTTTLGELLKIKHGYAFKGEFFSTSGPYILLTPGNFLPDGGIKLKGEKEKYYIGQFPEDFLLNKGDLLIVMTDLTQTAAILGSPAFIPRNNLFLHNQRLGKIHNISSNVAVKFLYYLLNTNDVREQIKGSATGATVRHTAPERTYKVKVDLPPLPTQHKIASILSAYDDLIENNLRRIKILEEMGQNLYREWFVKFRFPGHENARFVDSPLGKIPEGWEIVKVGEVLKKMKRLPKVPKGNYVLRGLFPVIDQGKDFIGGYTDDENAIISDVLPVIIFGDHTRILKYINFPFARGADGTQILKSNNERMPMSLFFYALSAIDLSNYAYARHFKFIKDELILLPDIKSALLFEEFMKPNLNHKKILSKSNINLRQNRDHLLPKLISGEVDVSELDIKVPEEVLS